MQPDDWEKVGEIYREGIDTKLATFETEVPTWAHWDESHLSAARPTERESCRLGGAEFGFGASGLCGGGGGEPLRGGRGERSRGREEVARGVGGGVRANRRVDAASGDV